MFKKILYCLLASLLFVSCVITPPSTDNGDPSVSKTNLRSIEVKCIESTYCLNGSSFAYEAVAIYTTDGCNSFESTSPIVGLSREELTCDDSGCHGFVHSFKKEDGVEDAIVTNNGQYSLVAFIDINNNEFPDIGEPFYCNAEVDITAAKRLTNIQIEIDRLLAL